MCVLSLYKGHLTKLGPFVLSFCRTYHIGTLIICRHSFHPSPHLVIVLLDVTTDTHHHFPMCIIRVVLLPPVPHQDSLICAAPVSPITYRSLIIRAVICHPSPRQGLIRAVICCHPSPHLDMDHSCCHFSLISRHQFIIVRTVILSHVQHRAWVINAVLCHSSRVRACIRAVTVVTHHIRTCILRSVTTATHYHTWTLIILVLSFRALLLVTDSYIRTSFVLPICHS